MSANIITSFPPGGERRLAALVIAGSLLCTLAILANLAFQVFQARADIEQRNAASATRLARVLQGQTNASLDAVDLALQTSGQALALLPAGAPGRQQAIDQLLAGSIGKLPFIRAIWVADAGGNVVHDTEQLPGRSNLAEREYFQIHRDDGNIGLYIDRPVLSSVGVPFIALSRRLNRADGSFGGVIVAALEPDYLRRFYQSIRTGEDGMVALVRADGTLMLRVPGRALALREQPTFLPRLMEKSAQAREGQYDASSAVDGIGRTFFFHQVARRPLVVVVGTGQAEMLAGWRRTSLAYGAVSLAFLGLVFWLSRLVLRELRTRAALHRALGHSDAAMKAAQQMAHIGSWRFDIDTGIGHWSTEMYHVVGIAPASAAPRLGTFLERAHPDDRAALRDAAMREEDWAMEVRTNPAFGPMRYLYSRSSVHRDAHGKMVARMGSLQDITQQRETEEKLRLSARVFEHTSDGIIVTDANNLMIAANAACERITGYSEAELLGRTPQTLHTGLHEDAFFDLMWAAVRRDGTWRGETWSRRKNGEIYPKWLVFSAIPGKHGAVDGYVAVFTDLTEIRHANQKLRFLSNHDLLTGLPNRSLLVDRLQQAIDAAGSMKRQFGILLLNLDRIKRINEGIGHDAGDTLLRTTGARLQSRLQPGETLARVGSDEFALLLTQVDDTDDINARTQQLLELVAQPCMVGEHELALTASIGIALYPADGETPAELMKNAGSALSHVKQGGRNSFRYFTTQMNIRALHWMSLEHRLRGALARGELLLHYQPQMCLATGALCGVEALIRWHSEALGSVSPGEFIPLAEDTGLILPIGEWVIRSACLQGKAWQNAGLAPVRIAVNVSAHQISAGNVPAQVRAALAESGLAPQYLAIELTESVLMKEAELAQRQIAELRAMGIIVALDDFGTGYSSLSYLSRYALDKIKIDQSLVRHLPDDPKSSAVAGATIGLAHGLGLTVVAEGVETREQLEFLRGAGCDEVQGFLYSRPVPAAQLALLLAEGVPGTVPV